MLGVTVACVVGEAVDYAVYSPQTIPVTESRYYRVRVRVRVRVTVTVTVRVTVRVTVTVTVRVRGYTGLYTSVCPDLHCLVKMYRSYHIQKSKNGIKV